jgi:hypothetical protein
MTKPQTRRHPGRPRSGRKPRIDATLSQEALDFIDWLIGEQGNVSQFLDEQIKAHPRFEEWKQQKEQVNA